MQRVMILALDGLEPSLVDETMPHLLQKEHGMVEVDVSPLQTPVIWASFLTGKEDNGISMIKFPYDLDEKISRILGPKRVASINRFSSAMNINNHLYTKDDLVHPTIFDLVDKYIALNIPAYNEDPVYLEIRNNIAFAIGGRYPREDLSRDAWNLFYREYDDCLKILLEEWDLFMVHFFVTDVIGHLSWDDPTTLRKCYHVIDDKIRELREHLNDVLIMIVSDHGMQNGLHTRRGYYSVNHELQLTFPKITEFYGVIKGILSNQTFTLSPSSKLKEDLSDRQHTSYEQEKAEVLRHLKKLGYF